MTRKADPTAERVRRLEWLLRAIDERLHDDRVPDSLFCDEDAPDAPTHYAIPAETLRQICRVIVAATGTPAADEKTT